MGNLAVISDSCSTNIQVLAVQIGKIYSTFPASACYISEHWNLLLSMDLFSFSLNLLILSPRLPVAAPPLTCWQCFPWCTPNAPLAFLSSRALLGELVVHQDTQVLLCRADFQQVNPQPVVSWGYSSPAAEPSVCLCWTSNSSAHPLPRRFFKFELHSTTSSSFPGVAYNISISCNDLILRTKFLTKRRGITRPFSHVPWAICIWHLTTLLGFFLIISIANWLCVMHSVCWPSFCRKTQFWNCYMQEQISAVTMRKTMGLIQVTTVCT